MKTIITNSGHVIMVDDEDHPLLSRLTWSVGCPRPGSNTVYAYAMFGKSAIYMHRMVSGCQYSLEVDHIDRNGLNNQKSNLRIATRSQNLANQGVSKRNTSGFKGVKKGKGGSWCAQVGERGKQIHIGSFKSPEEAAAAYDAEAERVFGRFARTNKSMGLL